MKYFINTLLLTLFVIFLITPAFAEEKGQQINLGDNQKYGIPAVRNPNASIGNLVSNAITIMFIIGGLAVLVFIVWGAIDWITSEGDKEKISAARKKITNSLIGLALLALSFFIITLAGQVVGFNPLETEFLPRLDDPARQAPRTTP